ncbi:MAG: pyridoxal-dependent decarboxylase [Balneolales bacterium]
MDKNNTCTPEEVAIKSFFLGPQSENAVWAHELILHVFREWYQWRKELYSDDGRAISEKDQLSDIFTERKNRFRKHVDELMTRFQNEVPSFSPRYIGHMVTEISLPALVGHIITLLHNPNNISGEASRVGIAIEDEAVSALLEMIGCEDEESTGHFTSGGTLANFEGAVRARSRMVKWLAAGAAARSLGHTGMNLVQSAHMGWEEFDRLRSLPGMSDELLISLNYLKQNPFQVNRRYFEIFGEHFDGPVVLVASNKHYSWNKAVNLLGMGDEAFKPLRTDSRGKMDAADLEKQLNHYESIGRPVMMIISVGGTTELGNFDPIDKVNDQLSSRQKDKSLHYWHHVDAAYGGFFCCLSDEKKGLFPEPLKNAFKAIKMANSVTIDPHKLGYVPYASGAFLCRSRREYHYKTIHAPYIEFNELTDRGPQTLEGSRTAAGAVSTWLTSRVIGFDREGYGRILERSVAARVKLEKLLTHADSRIHVVLSNETNILCFCVAEKGETVSETNARSMKIYDTFSPRENHEFFVSKTALDREDYRDLLADYTTQWDANWDTERLVLIRLVLINPFFDTKETNVSYPEAFTQRLMELITKEETEIVR